MNSSKRLLSAVVALATLGMVTALGAADKTNYIYASFASSELPDSKAIQKFLDAVNEKSENVQFEASFGGAMGGPRELISSISTSVVHAGNIIDGYAPKELAGNSVLRVLGNLGGDQIAVSGAVNETILLNCPRCMQDMKNLDLYGLGSYSVPHYVLICRSPIENLEGFKASRVRAAGEFAQMLSAAGTTPVQIPFPETYEALQRGQVDCSHSQASYLRAANFWDVAKYVYDQPQVGIYNTAQLFAVNGQVWQGLSDADKQVILDEIPAAVADAVFRGREELEEITEAAADKEVSFSALPDDVAAAIEDYQSLGNLEKVIADLGGKLGYDEAVSLMEAYKRNLEKWTGMLPEISKDRAAFAEALRREVYSKFEM